MAGRIEVATNRFAFGKHKRREKRCLAVRRTIVRPSVSASCHGDLCEAQEPERVESPAPSYQVGRVLLQKGRSSYMYPRYYQQISRMSLQYIAVPSE